MPDPKLERLLSWQNGHPQGPYKVTVFPTNICNLECKHCWRIWADYDRTYKSELSDERLLELIDEGAEAGVEEWYFVGGGDPMARGKLMMKVFERIRELGMNGTVHTNGTLFKPGMLERLIEIGWDRVMVSIDGPDRETNDFIRSGGFDKAVACLRKIRELREESGTSALHSVITVTMSNLTCDRVDDFVRLSHDIGNDGGVNICGLIVEGEDSAQFELSPEQKAALPGNVEKARLLAEELGVENNFSAYLDEELVTDALDMHRGYSHETREGISGAMCYEPWKNASILPDGRVGPCCAFFDEDIDSIKDRGFKEVWEGAYMTQVRQGMLDGNPPDYCKRCPSNLFMIKEEDRAVLGPLLEEHISYASSGIVRRGAFFLRKGLSSIKRRGLIKSLVRGAEWRRIHDRGQ